MSSSDIFSMLVVLHVGHPLTELVAGAGPAPPGGVVDRGHGAQLVLVGTPREGVGRRRRREQHEPEHRVSLGVHERGERADPPPDQHRRATDLPQRDADVVGVVAHRRVGQVGDVAGEVAAQVERVRLPAALGEVRGDLGPQPRAGQRAVHEEQRRLAAAPLGLVRLEVDALGLDEHLVALDRLHHRWLVSPPGG